MNRNCTEKEIHKTHVKEKEKKFHFSLDQSLLSFQHSVTWMAEGLKEWRCLTV